MRSCFGARLASLVVITLLLCGTFAQAAIIGSATLIKDPTAAQLFAAPDTGLNAALSPSWQSYRLSLTATAGELIQAVDVSITGQLHQRWNDTDFDGDPTNNPTANGANQTQGDSHLLAPAGSLFGSGPSENNPGTGSPLPNPDTTSQIYGVGSFLSGAWGLPTAASTANLAYIVIPKGSTPNLQIGVKVADPSGSIIGNLSLNDFFQTVQPPVVTGLDLTNNILGGTVSGQPTATNSPTSWSPALNSLVLASYTPNYGAPAGAPGLLLQPTWDPTTQQFAWNTSGSTKGDYTWNVSATNAGGTGNGTIVVHQTAVPEPATLTLVGLAALGLVGMGRRRS